MSYSMIHRGFGKQELLMADDSPDLPAYKRSSAAPSLFDLPKSQIRAPGTSTQSAPLRQPSPRLPADVAVATSLPIPSTPLMRQRVLPTGNPFRKSGSNVPIPDHYHYVLIPLTHDGRILEGPPIGYTKEGW